MYPPAASSAPPSPAALGALTARTLVGAWRAAPPAPTLTPDELEALVPHLLATGTAGLAWWAVKDDERLAQSDAGRTLRDSFRMQVLHRRLHELRLAAVLDLTASLGLDPLLLKGWSVARAYPSLGLRPCGDVDLVVPATEHVRLQRALDERPRDDDWIDVDLEHRFLTTDGTPLRTLQARAVHVPLDGRAVRIACPEDQLRLVCVHYLRAGGFQPRALCDIALLLETRPAAFDWEIALGDTRQRQWVTVAAGLAERLLGADLSGTPLQGATVPAWVGRHVLEGFGTTSGSFPTWLPPFRPTLNPAALAAQLRARCATDGLATTLHHRRPIPARGPLANQCYDLAYRAVAMAVPVRMKRARRDGSPELAG
jgi:hypothetical protein